MWPFKRKPEPPAPPIDMRNWNEDWRVGDTAECIIGPRHNRWSDAVIPWNRPALGQRFLVTGFVEAVEDGGQFLAYFLKLEGWQAALSTTAFRKVRPVAAEQSEIVERILKAKPGKARVREDV